MSQSRSSSPQHSVASTHPEAAASPRARRHDSRLALILIAVACCGVLAQTISTGRPLLDLTYYTVQSALLLALTTALGLVPRLRTTTALAIVRGAATVGSVVAGIIYTVAIAPGEGDGRWLLDEPLAAVGSTLQHLVLPILGIVVLRREVIGVLRGWRPGVLASLWLMWPLAWALVLAVLRGVAGVRHHVHLRARRPVRRAQRQPVLRCQAH